jgi:hypothetical protein
MKPDAGLDAPSMQRQDTASKKARQLVGQWAQSATYTLQSWTTPKYTLPDKNVASQVLMYRQLLHTPCRPSLKLSRDFQGTPAQVAVMHMPWWSEGIQETGKMVISYDNLLRRLWLHGAIFPFNIDKDGDTLLDPESNMPPIPHPYWVDRLGFQQPDPVTDFRSGGVLSLAMMVHICESCPHIHARFQRPNGDASVLPFGITSINITDMMAKFLMLAKAIDRMDALLSQKPFWKMFGDPNALLACQELSLDLLADVVVELRTEREYAHTMDATSETPANVTVFDFAHILAVTERRVQHDLLGAGPTTVAELRTIHARLKQRYSTLLQQRCPTTTTVGDGTNNSTGEDNPSPFAQSPSATTARSTTSPLDALHEVPGVGKAALVSVGTTATQWAGNVWNKLPKPGWTPGNPPSSPSGSEAQPTLVNLPPKAPDASTEDDNDWAGTDIAPATDAVSNFSIGGDDEEDFL